MNSRKLIIVGTTVAIVVLALFALGTVAYSVFNSPGVQTKELDPSKAKPASVDLNGEWVVVHGNQPNVSSVGFTFQEILPAEEKITSGSTNALRGQAFVDDTVLTRAKVEVDMNQVGTDQEKRDINVRTKIFETDKFPTAQYELDKPVNLSDVPDNGSVETIDITGKLTIHGVTKEVTSPFKVLRSGKQLIISTIIPINRLDYGVETPEFVAAKINEEGEVNVLLTFEKKQS